MQGNLVELKGEGLPFPLCFQDSLPFECYSGNTVRTLYALGYTLSLKLSEM